MNSTHIITMTASLKGNKLVISGLRSIEKNTKKVTQGFKKASPAAKGLGAQMMALGKRALLVAPLWMAMRSAMLLVITSIRDGIKYWAEYDTQILKSEAVMSGFEGTLEDASNTLKETISGLTTFTGATAAKLASSFYRFGTVGLNFNKSMEGMKASTRGAMALFLETDEVAQILSRTYLMLGESMDGLAPKGKEMETMLAQIWSLWKVNSFESKEFKESLTKFLPTAASMNFSFRETINLLATLNSAQIRGSRGGRLLRTSITKMVTNMDKLALSLGLHVNPEAESFNQIFERVISKLRQLNNIDMTAATDAINDIFGGVRGGEIARGLVAMYDKLQENNELTNLSMEETIALLKDYNKEVNKVSDGIENQLKITEKLKKEVGMAFVGGVVGGEDFGKSLKKMNGYLESSKGFVHGLGRVLIAFGFGVSEMARAIDRNTDKLVEFREEWGALMDDLDNLTPDQLIRLQRITTDDLFEQVFGDIDFVKINKRISSQIILSQRGRPTGVPSPSESAKRADVVAQKNLAFRGRPPREISDKELKAREELERNKDINTEIINDLIRKGKILENELTILKMSLENVNKEQLAWKKVDLTVGDLVKKYNSLEASGNKLVKPITSQALLTLALKNDWTAIKALTNNEKFILEGMLVVQKQINEAHRKKIDLLKDETGAYDSLLDKYREAEGDQKTRIYRAAELKGYDPEQLSKAYQTNPFDAGVIDEFMSVFNDQQQRAVRDLQAAMMGGFPGFKNVDRDSQLPRNRKFLEDTKDFRAMGITQKERYQQITGDVNIDVALGDILLNFGEGTAIEAGDIGKAIGDAIEGKLLQDEIFLNKFRKKV